MGFRTQKGLFRIILVNKHCVLDKKNNVFKKFDIFQKAGIVHGFSQKMAIVHVCFFPDK